MYDKLKLFNCEGIHFFSPKDTPKEPKHIFQVKFICFGE